MFVGRVAGFRAQGRDLVHANPWVLGSDGGRF
jgi:hypothetical protein